MNTNCRKNFTNLGEDLFFRDHYVLVSGRKIVKNKTDSK